MRKKQFPTLAYFLETYLNQDFEEIYGSADLAFSQFLETETTQTKEITKELDALLASPPKEKDLQYFLLKTCDCNYDFLSDWKSALPWLQHLKILIGK